MKYIFKGGQTFSTNGVKNIWGIKLLITKENIAKVNKNPHVNLREFECESGISEINIIRILKKEKCQPYHLFLHQDLHRTDFINRIYKSPFSVEL